MLLLRGNPLLSKQRRRSNQTSRVPEARMLRSAIAGIIGKGAFTPTTRNRSQARRCGSRL